MIDGISSEDMNKLYGKSILKIYKIIGNILKSGMF